MSRDGTARWPFWVRALIGAFATIGAAYAALMVWISLGHVCMVEDTAVVPSPSGDVVAHISQRTCKPEIPATEVSLVRRDASNRYTGETVFKASAKPSSDGGSSAIRVYVSWVDDSEVRISYPYAQRFESRTEQAMGVKVSYHEVSPR